MIDLDNDLIHSLTFVCLPCVWSLICDCCIHAFMRIITFITRKITLRNWGFICEYFHTMDYGRRNTKKYNFKCLDLKELRKLSSFVLDPLDFKQCHGKILSILFAGVVEGLLSVLVQFYDPLYRCFTFSDYQLMPTLEDFLGCNLVYVRVGYF